MKTERKILIAFLLNFSFSIFEIIGGLFTGSVAIISDAIHDLGDAASIGISYFLEKKSKKVPDEIHTYGYARYSVLGGLITSTILLLGSIFVIYRAAIRIASPIEINYNGMILYALFGVFVNVFAAIFTREGNSINQKAVNLHMLEDALGWIVVLIGAIVMRFTGFSIIDPLLSILVSIFILIHSIKYLRETMDIFLEKSPNNIKSTQIQNHLTKMKGVLDVHHIHLWSLDEQTIYATMHVVTNENSKIIKESIREKLHHLGIAHVTLELEKENEHCKSKECCNLHQSVKKHCHH